MQAPGYWGNRYFKLNYWADNYWFENEAGAGEPYHIFYANKNYNFLAMKLFTFPTTPRNYLYNALKQFVYSVKDRTYTFNATKLFIFPSGSTMTTPSYFEKLPNETYTIGVEWANQLPFAATLTSGTVAVKKMDDNSDVTATLLSGGSTCTISGTQSRIKVTGGKVQVKYRFLFTVVLSNGEQLQEAVYCMVREP